MLEMSTPLTNIRVFVQWTEQTVFAGEDIECQITFKNVAATAGPTKSYLHPSGNGFTPAAERQRKPSPSQIRNSSNLSPRPAQPARGHRSTLSLNVPTTSGRAKPGSVSGSWNGGYPKVSLDGNTHKRSLSIISIGASETAVDELTSRPDGTRRISRGHGRSASLQIVPRRPGGSVSGPPSGIFNSIADTELLLIFKSPVKPMVFVTPVSSP